ncbi:MAG: EFR1 family ferrodoxin [Chitinispirillaceae bacterium]|nr:EFR1 family ferrodoxin [Chitinispirillaceae bacterium]
MKIITFFFSGTGNTWWATRKINEIFRKSGHYSIYCPIEKNIHADFVNRIDEFDMIGFSYPIYGANFPPVFKLFLEQLIESRSDSVSKACFTLCTIGYVNALGPFAAQKILKQACFKLVGSLNIKLTNNTSVPNLKTKVFNDHELDNRKEQALRKIQHFAEQLTNNKKMITGIGPYLIPGYIIRKISDRKIKKINEIWSVDQSRCLHCNLCITICPTNSIIFTNNVFEFKNTCTACFRCYNVCPANAILHTGTYADPKYYIRYKGPEKDWYKKMVLSE